MKPGTYRAKPVDSKYGKSKNGTHQIGVRLEVTEGEQQGKTGVWYGSFTPAAEEWAFKAMEAMGYKGKNPMDLSCLTEEVSIVVADETYKGETRSKIKFINPLGGVTMHEDMNAGEQQSFADKFRGAYARYKSGTSDEHPSEQSPPPISDEDIPF